MEVLEGQLELVGVDHRLLQEARLQQLLHHALQHVRCRFGLGATVSADIRTPLEQDERPLVPVELAEELLLVGFDQPLPQELSPLPLGDVGVRLVEEEDHGGREPPPREPDVALAGPPEMQPHLEDEVVEVSQHLPAQAVEAIVPGKTLVSVEHLEERCGGRYDFHLVPTEVQHGSLLIGAIQVPISERHVHRHVQGEKQPKLNMAENLRHDCVGEPEGGG
mmetsp:Transcript_62655/g.186754  ORF Transcript_62655/g.186754 Transcript_62655/m.186754 type:complete len:221 (-) Transcript_62655:180-842(-)